MIEDGEGVEERAGPPDACERVLGMLSALASHRAVRDKGPDPLHAAVGAFQSGLNAEQGVEVDRAWEVLLKTLTVLGVYDEASVPEWSPRELQGLRRPPQPWVDEETEPSEKT